MNTSRKLTERLIQDNEGGYTGYYEQFPEAIAEGETVQEVRANMQDALSFILEHRSEDGFLKIFKN